MLFGRILPNNNVHMNSPHDLHYATNLQIRRLFWNMVSAKNGSAGDERHRQKNSNQFDSKPDIQMPARQDFSRPRDCSKQISELLKCGKDDVLDASQWAVAKKEVQRSIDADDFNLAFDLLDRLAKDPHAKREVSSEFISLIIQQWLSSYERFRDQKGEFTQFMYSPDAVWRKIDQYMTLGLHIESRTVHWILEATALVKNSRKWNAPMLAETILERMIELSRYQNPDVRPSTFTFNAVIASWEAAAGLATLKSEMTLKEAPERALSLLQQLKGLHDAGWGDDLLPDKNTYRRVMNMFAQKGDGEKVEELMEEMYELYQEYGHRSLQPTTPLFSLVLYAWSKSKDPNAAERAQDILDHMLEMEKNKEFPGFKVSAFCFNIVMVCWSKQRTKRSAQKAQNLFDRMVALSETDSSKRPIPGSYAALMQTWSYFDAKRAEDIFWMWKREHNLGNVDMRVESKLFSMLIAGWFHSKDFNAAKRCDKLLQHALKGDFGPAWQPHAASFNMTINAYCRRSKNQDIERAEELLLQMKEVGQNSSNSEFSGPSAASYVPVIHALTRLGRAERAEALLREWFDGPGFHHAYATRSSRDGRDVYFKKKDLNTKTFNRVLKAWLSKAPISPDAADRAEALLLKMADWGVKPNIASFHYVLECRKKIQNEHKGLVDLTPKIGNSQILELLDKEYETGSLSEDKSAYLSTRRDLALIAL